MPFRAALFLVALPLLALAPVSGRAGAPAALEALLTRSPFGGAAAPAEILPGVPYHALLLSVLASQLSQAPAREEALWPERKLPAYPGAYCPGPMRARVKRARAPGAPTFLVLPGAYATYRRGSFLNQTAAQLTASFGDVNLIALPGYLSDDFLRGTCDRVPWNYEAIARDLYTRLRPLLAALAADPERTGLVGYSGGGLIGAALLARDAEPNARESAPAFGLGGMLFSPILHGRTTFAILDQGHRESRVDPSYGLTTMDWSNALLFVRNKFASPGVSQLAEIFARDPGAFRDRFYNEFSVVDLAEMLSAVGFRPPGGQTPSYYRAHVRWGAQADLNATDAEADEAYDRATDTAALLEKAGRPLFIYFSKDDPVLSNPTGTEQPAAVSEVLERAKQNPHVTVFNPRYGGHAGALLDPIFPVLLKTFFAGASARN